MTTPNEAAVTKIRKLVDDLVAGDYAKIERDGYLSRLTKEELKRAIEDYGRTLIPIPKNGLSEIDTYPIDGHAEQISIDCPLWTQEEGMSDLTLSLTITQTTHGVKLSIDDLHVL